MINSLLLVQDQGVFNLALIFGLVILGGTLAARVSQFLRLPQVVGCIVIGIVLGAGLGVIKPHTIESLEPFTMFALGVIGFMIGGELRAEIFKKYGKQFFTILLSQGLGAFFFVTILISIITFFALPVISAGIEPHQRISFSIAVGLLLGAIASATAPAATANVLWENKTRGPLTATILAIVALDDALALLLYRGAATGAKALTGSGTGASVLGTTLLLLGEIAAALFLGFLAAVILVFLLRLVKAEDKILEFTLAALLIVVGITIIPGIDPILPAMVLGLTIANLLPRQSKNVFKLMGKFSPPIYVAFFVLAGAHMQFDKLSILLVLMIIIFILARAFGKISGSWLGAKITAAPDTVRKYLGLCLLPQAGVSIGLAILAAKQFDNHFGQIIILVVMTATFVMEIVGPVLVRLGVQKAGEIGLNVTEEDLLNDYNVADIMDSEPPTIPQDMPFADILDIFSKTENLYYPVIDSQNNIIGLITIAGIKEMFANQDVCAWLLACDVAENVIDKTTPGEPLVDVVEHMQKYDLESIPVVDEKDSQKLVGILDLRKTMRKISAEVLRRKQLAEGL